MNCFCIQAVPIDVTGISVHEFYKVNRAVYLHDPTSNLMTRCHAWTAPLTFASPASESRPRSLVQMIDQIRSGGGERSCRRRGTGGPTSHALSDPAAGPQCKRISGITSEKCPSRSLWVEGRREQYRYQYRDVERTTVTGNGVAQAARKYCSRFEG